MRIFTLLGILFVFNLCINSSDAQRRYLEPIFDEVEVADPIVCGSNFHILNWLFGAPNLTRFPLRAQIYQPKGDTERDRPLVIYLHTGNFFPFPLNGSCGGTLTDSSNVEIATRLAKMGYVVAVVTYRLGWNPQAEQELVRRLFLINAAYRGVQDVRTYVRYFKRSVAEANNPHGIDPDKIVVWGQGTGGYLSLASSYLNNYNQILTTSDPNKFFVPAPPPANRLPMVLEQYNGDIYGTSGPHIVDAVYNAFIPFPIGDTLSVPNHVGYSSDFALGVNMGGALGDSTWILPGNIPTISFHVPTDGFAPCETNVLNVPTTGGPQPVVEVTGSCHVHRRIERLGINEIFADVPEAFDPFGAKGRELSGGAKGFYPFVNTPDDTSAPWEWQSENSGAMTDCNLDGAQARRYIDTIIGFYAPRACLALKLDCDFSTNTKDLNLADVDLKVSPNPASNFVNISSAIGTSMKDIYIYDISGRLMDVKRNINKNNAELQRGNLQAGLYILRIQFEQGIVSYKLLFD